MMQRFFNGFILAWIIGVTITAYANNQAISNNIDMDTRIINVIKNYHMGEPE